MGRVKTTRQNKLSKQSDNNLMDYIIRDFDNIGGEIVNNIITPQNIVNVKQLDFTNYTGEHFPVHSYMMNNFNIFPSKLDIASVKAVEGVNLIDYLLKENFTIVFKKVETRTIKTDITNNIFYLNTNDYFYETPLRSIILVNNDLRIVIDIFCEDIGGKQKEEMATDLLSNSSVIYNIEVYYDETIGISPFMENFKTVIKDSCTEKEVDKNNYIYLITNDLRLEKCEIKDMKLNSENLSSYYNDDFLPVNDYLLSALNESSKAGILFLHGEPGTGKTSYIRYLVTQYKYKSIYITPDKLNHLGDSSFLKLLIDYKNSILILEDCGDIIKKGNHSNIVSNLLNYSDGILGDIINVKIIITFNENINDISDAFIRNGRCLLKYEFKKLAANKVNKLNSDYNEDMTLGEIFKPKEDYINNNKKNKIGF